MAGLVVPCKSLTLHSGRRIPVLGFGTYAPRQDEEDMRRAVKTAVGCGYRHIDCATIYRNHRVVGRGLKELFDEGIVHREDVFIVSKLWNTCHQPSLVEPSLKNTLEELGLTYLDLYLMHWPMAYKEGGDLVPRDGNGKVLFSDVDYLDTWKAMEECVTRGLVRDIGCSNFNSEQLQRLSDKAQIPPAVNQIEVNCYMTNKQLVEYCQSRHIIVTAFGPLGTPSKQCSLPLLQDPVLEQIATRHSKTPAQVALRFLIQQDICVVPKSISATRIEENSRIFDFELTSQEMEVLHNLNKNHRNYFEPIAVEHKYYPFHAVF